MRPEQTRTYDRANSVVFLKTKESFGGLSNMAGGFPLRVNGILILTSEALYQACRFPHLPDVQRLILEERSPMTAKMKSKHHRENSRSDWDHVRVKIMRWCLRVKLAQNWRSFSELLLKTGKRPIVEESRKDDFWGAKLVDERTLVGVNVLGRLLMELREAVKAEGRDGLLRVEPVAIPDFLLGGRLIGTVFAQDSKVTATTARPVEHPSHGDVGSRESTQPSFFDAPVVKEGVPPAYLDGSATGVRIADLKPYPEYKESGIAWARSLPRTWRTERAKWLFTKMARPVRPVDEVVTCFRDGMVTLRKNRRLRGFTEATVESGYQGIRKGDLVIHGMDAFAGAIGVSDSDGKGTPVYNVCQPRPGVIARYYAHTVREMSQSQWILALAKGIRERSTDFRYEMFGNQRVPLPPPAEQAAIVRFLDWANGRLERTIRAKRKVIALLTKQKQTIIHRAVTRGLDTSVPLKPSGIPWLGDIPRHWEVSRVKNEFRCLNTQRVPLNALERGGMTSRIYDYYGASGVIDKVDDYIFDEELLLIAEDGANLVLRNLPLAIIARGKFWVNNHAHILKPKRGSILYLAHLLETLNYAPWISGAAQPKLTKDRLMSITIAVAPSDEQDAIVRHTAEQTRPLVTAISRLEREIELLREYRTRLVSDTVTGKLDVREAAEGLPDLKDDVASRETADEVAGAKELEEASGQEEAQG